MYYLGFQSSSNIIRNIILKKLPLPFDRQVIEKKKVMQSPMRILSTICSGLCLFILACQSKSDDIPHTVVDPIDSVETLDPIVFSAIGDVPYNNEQRDGLINLIEKHNAQTQSEFVIHLGDIKPGADPCEEAVYQDVNTMLQGFSIPTFVVLGDNEYNDCDDPIAALALWNQYFLDFHQNWSFDQEVTYQNNRPENFAWVQEKVMFVGLNLVGSFVHDETEWNDRLTDNGDFLQEFVTAHGSDSKALVIFGHANMIELGAEKFELFTDVLRSIAREFDRPILYLQGDGHFWIQDRPYSEQNILRVEIEGGASAVQVTVNPNEEQPFLFDRNFLD